MKWDDVVASIERMRPGPADIIVFRLDEHTGIPSPEMRSELVKILGPHKAIIIGSGARVEIQHIEALMYEAMVVVERPTPDPETVGSMTDS